MKVVVDVREVDKVLSSIEEKLSEIKELTKDGFNAEQECGELLISIKRERESLLLPTNNRYVATRDSR